jgi:hypothetical protein
LQLFDLTNLGAPREVGRLDLPEAGESEDRAWSGQRVLEALRIADTKGRLRVVDVRDPSTPRELASIDTIHGAGGVAVDVTRTDGVAAVAAGEAGLWLVGLDGAPPRATPPPPAARLAEVIFAPIVARGAVGAACR